MASHHPLHRAIGPGGYFVDFVRCFKVDQPLTTKEKDLYKECYESMYAAIEQMKAAIPERWNTPGMDPLPNLAQVDFAVTRDGDGTLVPKLIELQGFPSLTSLQEASTTDWSIEDISKLLTTGLSSRAATTAFHRRRAAPTRARPW